VIHFASSLFWASYDTLPIPVRRTVDKNYKILKITPSHPSLHFKKVGKYWSVRIGIHYRALAVNVEGGLLWFWIGSHAEYDRLIKAN